ncbi:MAG: hypothetical protein AAGL18_12170 [Pseudomonadota bacterium]
MAQSYAFHWQVGIKSGLVGALTIFAHGALASGVSATPQMPGRTQPSNTIRLLLGVADAANDARAISDAQVSCTWLNKRVRLQTDRTGKTTVTVTVPRSIPTQLITVQCTVSHPRYVRAAFSRDMNKVTSPHPVQIKLRRR